MNIHEYQAKKILKAFGASTLNGFVILDTNEIAKNIKNINSDSVVLKAQIHAGGRGKAGGIKKIKKRELEQEDRKSSKIAFISSTEGGIDIENVAKNSPEKIITVKINLSNSINEEDVGKIIKNFLLPEETKKKASDLIKSIYKVLIEKDASLIEINPLVLTLENELICLDAKISFDDNALYKHPDIISLKDFNEEDPIETEAGKHDLSYIKLDGKIGCMVNGAGLAMATMDIIQLYGSSPANFLDVGGGASKEKVSAAFKIILSDKNVKGILINIFGGIMRCDVLAEGVVIAAKELNLSIPLVVRLAGTNVDIGKEILKKSNLKIISANNLSDAAKKIIQATK